MSDLQINPDHLRVLVESPRDDTPELLNAIMETGIQFMHTQDDVVSSIFTQIVKDENLSRDTRVYTYLNLLSVRGVPVSQRPTPDEISSICLEKLCLDDMSSEAGIPSFSSRTCNSPMASNTRQRLERLTSLPRDDNALLLDDILKLAIDFIGSKNLEVAAALESVVKDGELSPSTRQIALSSWVNVMSVPSDQRPSAANCETFDFDGFDFAKWYQA